MPKSKLEELYSFTCPNCGGCRLPKGAADPVKLSSLFESDIKRIAAELFSGKLKTGSIDLKSARKVAAVLSQAIAKGYGKEFPQIDFNTPDHEMYTSIQKQVFQFSFAKNYEQMKAASLALKINETVTPWPQFKEIVSRINNEYNVRFLQPEYNTAIGSSQMASRWVQYINDKVKALRYQTVGDNRVRPSHQELDGIIRAITDAFWSLYYPPNGWNCRCDAIDAGNSKATPKSKIPGNPEDVPPMFRRNLAKDGYAYPPDHPYFEHVPDAVLQAADDNNPFLYTPQYQGDKGGSVWVNALHGKKELKENMAIARFYADRGDMVILMPSIDPNSPEQNALRKMTLPEALVKSHRNADAMVNGRLNEFKTNYEGTVNSLKMQVRKGLKQADDVTVMITKDMKPSRIKKAITDQVNNSYQGKSDQLAGRTVTVIRNKKATLYRLEKLVKKTKGA